MRRRNSLRIVLVGNGSSLKEEVARILRSANFCIAASVSRGEDFPGSEVQPGQLLFLIVHTGDDFFLVAEQIELLRRSHAGGRIAVVTDRYRQDEMTAAFRVGSNGYFADVVKSDVFIKSIELVMTGEVVPLPRTFLRSVFGPESAPRNHVGPSDANNEAPFATPKDVVVPQLSPRERAILRCLVEGESNKSIARKFQITVGTVKGHVKATLRKIGVGNRTQAAIWEMHNRSLARTTGDSSPRPACSGI
ncbi:response regulator transcription factor [Bradyrhizobium sp. CB1650]|uniref:response regulator transcription factor n=1 Tax=Bradyrhizobium sp. CB1650 TaxID=3039153 RepID=UPI002435C582|nr:response regulator transcription factor [Bradyrhizobium sp. CB1650]WGD55007.1 response regulator transcription factor [Bradyrhizobium sp. CB1650]